MSARSEVDVVDLVPVEKVADAVPYIATSGSTGGRGGQQAEDHVPLLEGYADALPMRCPARGRWSISGGVKSCISGAMADNDTC